MGKESSAVWIDPLIDVFCDLCIKEVDNNNRPNTHFNKFGWENLIVGFKQQTGKEYTKKQLKNKWDSLKEQWKLWRDLKGKETGLGWDSTLHNIVATDEWWSAKIEKTPEYAKFKKKGISPEFEAKMDRMFGGTSATGVHAYAPSSSLPLPSSSKGGDNTILLEGSGDSDDSPQASATPTKRRKCEKGKGVATRLSTGSVPSKKERFQHSLETIWRYYNIAIDVLNELAKLIIKPVDPQFNGVAPEILRDKRYMPHFKDCIGAIDGVHVPAFVPPEDQVPYIGRKGAPTQNIMAACDFHMQFIFVCAGWEGSAHDTRVFLSVLRNPEMNFPMPPPGKYYVVDSGYPQMSGFLTPYKGQKQHFQQYRGRGQEPRNEKEVFNQVHSSLRGVIERTFGVWKKKWKVLKDMQCYAIERQVKIVIATMALHNYIRRHASRDKDFTRFGEGSRNMSNGMMDMDNDAPEEYHGHGAQEMDAIRNGIAQSLMRARNGRNV